MSTFKEKQEAIESGNQFARKTIERIAKQEGLSYDTVYSEMQSSIKAAMQSKSAESARHFDEIINATGHETPTPEDFIIYCSVVIHNDPDVINILKFRN